MADALAAGLVFSPLRFSRNRLTHTIPAADPVLLSRVGLAYFLTIEVPEHPLSETFVELHTSEGREKPVVTSLGTSVYEGAEFTYNQRNGKLDGLLEYSKPRFGQAQMSALAGQTRRFRLRERVEGGEPAVETDATGPAQWVVKAGLDEEDLSAYESIFWTDVQATARRFLTWQPDGEAVSRNQEEYLYFLLNMSPLPSELRLRMITHHRTGRVAAATTVLTLSGAGFGQVVCCPVGPAVLGLADDVVRYEVWLSNETNARLSEVRTYLIDARTPDQERFLLFVNSLGGWDTIRLTGEAQQTLRVQQVLAERERPAGAAIDYNESLVVSTEAEREISVSTGYFPRQATAWLRYLDELLLSEDVYLIEAKGHLPLRKLTNQLVDATDRPDLVARTLTFVKGIRLENYSNLPALPPGSEPDTAWQGIEYRPVLDAFGKRVGEVVATRLRKVYADTSSLYLPLTTKPNTPGDPDYETPRPTPNYVPGTTPFPSAAINRPTTFKRQGCADGEEGQAATVVVPAGKYGGESQADADARAEAEYAGKNTQAYANANGTCILSGNYEWAVPAGKFHYRTNRPAQVGIGHSGEPNRGNLASFAPGPEIFAPGTNDLDLTPTDASGLWGVFVFAPAGSVRRIRFYRNGALYKDRTVTIPASGYYGEQLPRYSPLPVIEPASGDKFYIQVLDA